MLICATIQRKTVEGFVIWRCALGTDIGSIALAHHDFEVAALHCLKIIGHIAYLWLPSGIALVNQRSQCSGSHLVQRFNLFSDGLDLEMKSGDSICVLAHNGESIGHS